MKIYISRAKGLAVEPILAQLKPLIEKANFKSVEYFWYLEGTTYSSKALEESDMVVVISDETCGLADIGKGVYSEVKIAEEHGIEVFTFTPCGETGNHFLQHIDAGSDLSIHNEKDWSDYGSICIYYDTDFITCLTQDQDISEDPFTFFNEYYALNCFKGYGDDADTSSKTEVFRRGDTVIVTSLTNHGRFGKCDYDIKLGDTFTLEGYDTSDNSVNVILPDGTNWWMCVSCFQKANTEEPVPYVEPSHKDLYQSQSKVIEEINCDEDYLLLR